MPKISALLLGSVASLTTGAAFAADLPVKKAAPVEYVRVCSAYGAGFFYIPGTDTCLRVSGRARLDAGYQPTSSRASTNGSQGDTTGYIGLARINLDARTQTGYGTLRAFVRLQFASRTGATGSFRSGTQERIGFAYGGQGQDQLGRDQQFVNTDKAFIQFAGLTAGRASSFFDFYAHDFEFAGATANSDVQSTNLLAYTAKLPNGFSATVSLEDPTFRRNIIYSQDASAAITPARVLISTNALGAPTFQFVDVVQRNRMPDFVGVLRYDAAWGSAQLSGAVKELNTGNFLLANGTAGAGAGTAPYAPNLAGNLGRVNSEYGWAVQGGVKVNMPFIAPGDTLYLQGAYGEGATLYTGYSSYSGSYQSRGSTINGAPFDQYLSDASLNPLTGKIELTTSFTAVASFLHYWSPEWRSAVFGSYGELTYANGARLANAQAYGNVGAVTSNQFLGAPGTRSFALSPVLRDNYQFVAGASLIWSPVKDLDIGVEGFYTQIGAKSGRIIDQYKNGVLTAAQVNNPLTPVKTVSSEDTYQIRMRVQRDF